MHFKLNLCDIELNLHDIYIVSGHYKHHPIHYRAAVSNMLDQAASVYSQKIRLLGERTSMEGVNDEISELICDLQKVAVNSNQSLTRVALGPSDHFFLPVHLSITMINHLYKMNKKKDQFFCLTHQASMHIVCLAKSSSMFVFPRMLKVLGFSLIWRMA